MIYTGLCSIAFRKLKPQEIIDTTAKAGLDGIEWGGDVHVPHGNIACAKETRHATTNAGLKIASYGSYYRIGVSESEGLSFSSVLNSAVALGVNTIRVWAGNCPSAEADTAYFKMVAGETQRIADMAAHENITIAFECHPYTLNNSKESLTLLLDLVQRANVLTYWQPDIFDFPVMHRLDELKAALPVLANLHMFQWKGVHPQAQHLPLRDGYTEWLQYLKLADTTGRDHYAMIEHCAVDTLEQFCDDALTLKSLISDIKK
jgi:3-dehydroshikimate dehydratase